MAFSDLVKRTDRAVQGHLDSVTVSYQPQVGPAVPVPGMFDKYYRLVDRQADVETVVPAVVVRLEDLPVDPELDEPLLTIGGVVYKVRERQPDGDVGGSIRLLLMRNT